jgi:hypothetical protein
MTPTESKEVEFDRQQIPDDISTATPPYEQEQILNSMIKVLLTEADSITASITNAKTNTKKQYYKKKLKQIQKDILNAFAYKQHFANKNSTSTI